jgi:hypothetical protein
MYLAHLDRCADPYLWLNFGIIEIWTLFLAFERNILFATHIISPGLDYAKSGVPAVSYKGVVPCIIGKTHAETVQELENQLDQAQ